MAAWLWSLGHLLVFFLELACFWFPAWKFGFGSFFCCGEGSVVVLVLMAVGGGAFVTTRHKDESFLSGGLRHFDLRVCFFCYLLSF